MRSIIKLYQRVLTKYPLRTQAVQAGILMALGDEIAQNLIERKTFRELDYMRTVQFACIGFCIAGPATRTWYGILDRYIGSKGGIIVLKKVCCDQLLFAPTFIFVLLSVIGILQGNDVEHLKAKLQNEYSDILRNNYKVWPMVQLCNFYFVPLQYQVLVVQSIALLWNTYISYKTSIKRQE
ncbi:mitochondrial inner membrane protein MPV17 isoform X1 [Megalopta genalis]|uniref:mitochondrial inner membrane protein MPV17 isoform X1 n=2 Tax=Megalopta genalis TaxID=115081 RepID=UPI0014431A3D|nr:protein Mpv17 isoform X1 [Megalopta genalis]XP_033331783.1 protein Mpv17 isoform X1 [Megalopta genalis]